MSLLRQHRYKEAIPELTKGEQFYLGSTVFGPKHFLTIRAHEALVPEGDGRGSRDEGARRPAVGGVRDPVIAA